jgi:hypothetical protein
MDLKDLRMNCVYGGGYHDAHPSVEIFWGVVEEFDKKEREDLLMFVTSCSRPPLLGFRELHPSFCIQKVVCVFVCVCVCARVFSRVRARTCPCRAPLPRRVSLF